MKLSHVAVCAALAALALTTLGCSSHPGVVDNPGNWKNVEISGRIQPHEVAAVNDRTPPKEFLAHALALAEDDRWSEAGDLFSDLAEIRSRDGSWESRCHAAAAMCYLRAGRLDGCSEAARESGSPDGWARYAEPDEVRIVHELGAMIGETYTPTQLDAELSRLADHQ